MVPPADISRAHNIIMNLATEDVLVSVTPTPRRTSDQQYREASEPEPEAPAPTSDSTADNIDSAGAACRSGKDCTSRRSFDRLASLSKTTSASG